MKTKKSKIDFENLTKMLQKIASDLDWGVYAVISDPHLTVGISLPLQFSNFDDS